MSWYIKFYTCVLFCLGYMVGWAVWMGYLASIDAKGWGIVSMLGGPMLLIAILIHVLDPWLDKR